MKKQSKSGISELLDQFGLKKTRMRRIVLNHFLQCRKPQTQREILNTLWGQKVDTDSVTLYRTLLKLVGVGLIHKIPESRYLLCSHLCRRESHIVLNCESCETIWEIEDVRSVKSLGGMLADYCVLSENQPIFLNCLCKTCNQEHEVLNNGEEKQDRERPEKAGIGHTL